MKNLKMNGKKVVFGAVGTVIAGALAFGISMNGRSVNYVTEYIADTVATGVVYASEFVKNEIFQIDPEIEAENIRYGFETTETEDGYAEGYQFSLNEMLVNDNELVINGEHLYMGYTLGDIEVAEENGVVKVEAKMKAVEDFDGSGTPIQVKKTFKNNITAVYLAGDIIYEQGTNITSSASSLYKYKLESVSDACATKKLVYGTTVGQRDGFSVLDVEVVGKDIQVKMDVNEELFNEIQLEKDSTLILALAKDAESVIWVDKNGKQVYKLTVQEIGASIKKVAQSARALQKYIEDEDIESWLSY